MNDKKTLTVNPQRTTLGPDYNWHGASQLDSGLWGGLMVVTVVVG